MSFSAILEKIKEFFIILFKSVKPADLLDIILVAVIIYGLIRLIRDSRAEQLLKGIGLFILIFIISSLMDLKSLNFLLGSIFDNALIVMIVIFQPELRRALEQLGHSSAKGLSFINLGNTDEKTLVKSWEKTIAYISEAVELFQQEKTGALIVCERTTKLGEIIKTGTVVDAEASTQMIGNVFFHNAPLHDGAMIIRDSRIYAAGCILPLSDNFAMSKELGTRHRAAVGISEYSDAVAVVVSEETGLISIAVAGELKRNYSAKALQVALENYLIFENTKKEEKIEKTKTKKAKALGKPEGGKKNGE